MPMSNSERLLKCAERINWFVENQCDIRNDVIMPYAHTISVLVSFIQYYKGDSGVFITELEDTLSRAEADCKPEDAHHFVYDQDFKI